MKIGLYQKDGSIIWKETGRKYMPPRQQDTPILRPRASVRPARAPIAAKTERKSPGGAELLGGVFLKVILFLIKLPWKLFNGYVDMCVALSQSNMDYEREITQYIYGTGRYANREY